ncbi:MAG TPA: DUF5916 domain-containing protein [Clostridia bacterium]|nr:DUF5916 domain-containing protein [Clostridia bacterium]
MPARCTYRLMLFRSYLKQVLQKPRLGWLLVLVLLGTSAASAEQTNHVPSFYAVKTDEPITVDGVLDEPFWAKCPVATGLIDTRTQKQAEQQTTIRVAYTRTHLYIAVECFDDKISEIRASERRKDRVFTADDWVEIHFDPGHSHRGKYAFFTNPLGTRAEANEGPSGVFNYGWTVEWECEARIETNRWCFEMKIPFGAMNYVRQDAQTWGFNVTRSLRRTDTLSFWSYSATDTYKPRHFGHLEGFELADTQFSRQWEFTPYVSGRYDFGDGNSDSVFNAGGDLSFRLTPAITTALTLNPDYGQVEADDATIELRDTERLLPEKRLFFREGEELIRMPHRLYYSRRFTDIDAGAKISGAQQNYSFIFQDLYGATEHQDFHGKGNSALMRVYQYLHDRSYLGYYLADSELEEGYSRVAGADGYFFINDDWRTTVQAAGMSQDLDDPSDTFPRNGSDYLGHTALTYAHYPWEFTCGLKAISRGFKPLLSYVPRQDIFGPNFDAFYYHKSDKSWYKELSGGYEFDYYWNDTRTLSIHDHNVYGRVVFPNDFGLRSSYGHEYHAPYQNWRASGGFDLFASDFWKSLSFTYANGKFEDVNYDELILSKPFKPWNRLPIRFESFLRFEDLPDGSHDTKWLTRVVFDLYITDYMWIKSSIQPQNDNVHNVSVIYGWEFLPRKNFYLVFNSVNDGEETGTMNSIFSKVAWTF